MTTTMTTAAVLPELLADAWDEGHHAGHEKARAVHSPTTACRRRHADAVDLLTRLDNLKENTP